MTNWTVVPMTELREIWDKRTQERTTFNGHTGVDLVSRYGEGNVKHEAGNWWVRKPEARA